MVGTIDLKRQQTANGGCKNGRPIHILSLLRVHHSRIPAVCNHEYKLISFRCSVMMGYGHYGEAERTRSGETLIVRIETSLKPSVPAWGIESESCISRTFPRLWCRQVGPSPAAQCRLCSRACSSQGDHSTNKKDATTRTKGNFFFRRFTSCW